MHATVWIGEERELGGKENANPALEELQYELEQRPVQSLSWVIALRKNHVSIESPGAT